MRIIFSTILVLCLTMDFSSGQDLSSISDPELDFIQNSFLFKSVTQKTEIIRKEIDLTGEGQMTIFLRASVGGGKCGQYWTAYVKTGEDIYQRYEDIEFREDTFRAGKVPIFNPKGGILAYYPGKGAGDLIQITFNSGEAVTQKLRTIVVSNAEDQLVFERIFGRKLSDPIPDEFFKNPPHKVISVAEILARPQDLIRERDPSKSPDASVEVSNQVAKSQAPEKTSQLKQVQSLAERTPLASWTLVAALIVAVTVLLWLLLKKNAGDCPR